MMSNHIYVSFSVFFHITEIVRTNREASGMADKGLKLAVEDFNKALPHYPATVLNDITINLYWISP